MSSYLRRPAVALLATTLAASVLGIAPAAHAADGTLIGTVSGSGGPVESSKVELYQYEADGSGGGFWYQTDYYAFTDVDGAYSLTVPAGDYRVGFDGNSGDYAFEYYQDADTVEEGDTVTVPSDGTVQADVMLGAAAHVSGAVTDPDGAPVDNVIVAAYQVVGTGSDVEYRYVGFATTELGTYDIGGLPGGTYVVGFEGNFGESSATYATEYFNNQPNQHVADEVTLATAESRPGVDAQLELDSTISGTVTDVNGDPVDNGFVSAQVEVGAVWQDVDYADIALGTYTIDGLAADTYRVCFSAYVVDGYAYECWNNQGDVSTATDIGLGLNGNAPGIDAQLVHGEFVPPADPPVVNTSAPAITGTPQVGSPLTVSPGTWSPTPTTFDYYWFAGDAFVQGGTSATYVPTAADLGTVISVDVYAGADGYDYGYASATASAPVAAAPVPPAPTPAPTPTPTPTPTVDVPAGLAAIVANLDVSGKPRVGRTVKVTHMDLLLRTAVTYKFKWFAGTKRIKKANKYKLKLTRAMKGKKISVKVTATAASTSRSVRLKVGRVR